MTDHLWLQCCVLWNTERMVKLKYEQFTINSPDRRDLWIFLAWDLVGVGVKSCNEFLCLTLLISGWGEGGNCQNGICLFGSSYRFISNHRAYCSFNVVHLFSKWHLAASTRNVPKRVPHFLYLDVIVFSVSRHTLSMTTEAAQALPVTHQLKSAPQTLPSRSLTPDLFYQ